MKKCIFINNRVVLIYIFLVLIFYKYISAQTEWNNYVCGNYVNCLAIDDKYIWKGTTIGLVQIDKESGKVINYYNSNNSGLLYNNINCIVIDKKGNKWLSTSDNSSASIYRLTKFDGIKWTVYNTSNSILNNEKISGIVVDSQNNLWLTASEHGLVKYDGNNWTTFIELTSKYPRNNFNCLTVDMDDAVWVGISGYGLLRFDGVGWFLYTPSNSSLKDRNIYCLTTDALGNIWIGYTSYGLQKLYADYWSYYDYTNSALNNYIRGIAIDIDGNKWVIDQSGIIYKFDDSTWTVYDSINLNLPIIRLTAIAIDSKGNKWFSTYGNGLIKYDNNQCTLNNVSVSGLADDNIQDIALDSKGNTWIISNFDPNFTEYSNAKLNKFDGTKWTYYDKYNSGLISTMVRELAIDSHDNIWLATDKGLVKFDNTNNWRVIDTLSSDIPDNDLYSIAIDKNDNLWVGATNKILKFDYKNWTAYKTSDTLDKIRYIFIDEEDTKWIATYNGWHSHLFKLDSNAMSMVNSSQFGYIQQITKDQQDNIWFVCSNGGLKKYDGKNFTEFLKTNSSIPSNRVNTIAIDGDGNKWMGYNDIGFTKWDDLDWKIHNTENTGLLSNEINKILIDRNNNKWIGTGFAGLSIYNENGIILSSSNPKFTIYNPQFTIYPNPAHDFININLKEFENQEVKLVVYDIIGRVMTNKNLKLRKIENNNVQLSIKNLNDGIYILMLSDKDYTYKQKIIVNH